MFKADFDLTGGRLRRGVAGRAGSVGHSSSVKRRQRFASSHRSAFSQTLGPGQVPQLAGQGLGQQYSPVFDRAEIPDLGQQWLPADSQSQNKLFREIVTFDAIVGSAIEYWKDLTFSEQVILGGVEDSGVLQFFNDAVEASGVVSTMPMLLHDFLVFGRFVFHMLMDEGLGYWTCIIPHDLDYVSIQLPPIPSMDPLIDLQPNADQRTWATSRDPRIVEQRETLDPELVKLMAAGKQIPLAPENTMFLPRRAFSTDRIGTSYLTRVLMFKVYESAIYNASVSGARRRAGPLLHIKAWENALDSEMDDLLDLFFASEEDPVGAKIVTKAGVEVDQIGGAASDYWRFSEEWPFLVEGKMRALGISENFLCLTGSTLTPTEEYGLIRLDSFRDEGVDSRDVEMTVLGKSNPAKTRKWIYRGKTKTLRLTSERGYSIRCTPEHGILTLSGEGDLVWKEANKFNKGDHFCLNTKPCTRTDPLKLDLSDYVPNPWSRNTIIPNKPSVMTPDLAFLLGLLVSEGTHKKYLVRFSNSNHDLLKKYEDLVYKIFGLDVYISQESEAGDDITIGGVDTKINEPCYSVAVNSIVLSDWITQLGLTPGGKKGERGKYLSHIKEVPWSILQADADSQLAYIAAYIEGDGTISKHGSIVISSASRKNLKQLQIMLMAHGVVSTLLKKKYRRLAVNSVDARKLYKLIQPYMITKFLPEELLSRKKNYGNIKAGIPVSFVMNLFKERLIHQEREGAWFANDEGKEIFISKVHPLIGTYERKRFSYIAYEDGNYDYIFDCLKQISPSTFSKLELLLENRYYFDPVKSIKNRPKARVYDLSMQKGEEPAFVGNGIVLHNSGEANWNSMDTIRTIFIEKLQSLRSFFTKKIIIDKMFKQLAREKKFIKRKTAELDHHYRIAKPGKISDSDLIIPTVEWNRPLTPTKDQEYLDLLGRLREEYGFPIPPRTVAQAAGFDIDKMITGFNSDLTDRKRIYHFKRVLAGLQSKMNIDSEGNYEEPESAEDFGGGGEDFDFGGGGEEEFTFEEPAGGGETPAPAGGGEEAPAVETPAPGGEEGFGADMAAKRFTITKELKPGKGRQIVGSKPSQDYRVLGGKAVIDLLDTIPLWDEDDAAFGLPKRGVAKILYEVAQSNPSHNARVRLAKKLYRKLRKDGYNDLQAQTVEYFAIRLGYLPVAPLTQDVYSVLTRTVLGHMNGHGLTKSITDELVALSRLASDQQSTPLTHKAISALIKSPDSQLPPSRILTGYIDPSKDL